METHGISRLPPERSLSLLSAVTAIPGGRGTAGQSSAHTSCSTLSAVSILAHTFAGSRLGTSPNNSLINLLD